MQYSSSESATSDLSFRLSPLSSYYDRSRSPTPLSLDEGFNSRKRRHRESFPSESELSESKEDILPEDENNSILISPTTNYAYNLNSRGWFSGKDYLMMMDNIGAYKIYDNLGVSASGTPLQPRFIYTNPKECIYFLKCNSLTGRTSFAFPQENGFKKKYVWKKMGFTTDIPIEAPLVRYVTASCYKKGDKKVKSNGLFKMHAVIRLYYKDGKYEQIGDYVLVHIRNFSCKTSN